MSLIEELRKLPRRNNPYYRLTSVGGCVTRKLVGRQRVEQVGGGRRGKVRGFSKKSRKRFLALVNSLDEKKLDRSVFITLTYGRDWSRDGRVWKHHLNEFIRLLLGEYGKLCVLWKLEYQRRGAPHFHLVVVNHPFVGHEWISETWENIIGLEEDERGAATHVCGVRGGKNALFYVAGYLGKQSFVPIDAKNVGRVWGIRNKRLAIGDVKEYRLTVSEHNDFVRFTRKYANARGWKVARAQGGYKHTFMPQSAVVRWVDFVARGRGGCGIQAALKRLDATQRSIQGKVVPRASGGQVGKKSG